MKLSSCTGSRGSSGGTTGMPPLVTPPGAVTTTACSPAPPFSDSERRDWVACGKGKGTAA
eukprot:364197-Chlamydomonas_euryale.AAC.2